MPMPMPMPILPIFSIRIPWRLLCEHETERSRPASTSTQDSGHGQFQHLPIMIAPL